MRDDESRCILMQLRNKLVISFSIVICFQSYCYFSFSFCIRFCFSCVNRIDASFPFRLPSSRLIFAISVSILLYQLTLPAGFLTGRPENKMNAFVGAYILQSQVYSYVAVMALTLLYDNVETYANYNHTVHMLHANDCNRAK
jgi:hypothetical protein